MKKLIFLTLIAFAFITPVLAQTDPTDPVDISSYLLIPASVIAACLVLTGLIAKNLSSSLKIATSFAVAFALTAIGNAWDMGYAADFSWIQVVLWGAGIGAAANGFASWPWISAILEMINLKLPRRR